MSEPRTTYDDAMRGVTFELIGAMSSLNMEPEPMKEPTGSFLSESDTWASHAVEHIRAAIQLARKAEADNAALRLKMQEYNSALDALRALRTENARLKEALEQIAKWDKRSQSETAQSFAKAALQPKGEGVEP